MINNEKLDNKTKLEIVVEAGLQMIPYVGGSVATAYFGTKQAKEFKRIERLYSELSDELSVMKSKIASIKEQYEDGLVSLIEQVNDKVEKEHQELKFQCYKKYMKNILISPVNTSNYDKRKTFLDIMGHILILEIEIVTLLYNNYDMNVSVKSITKQGVDQYAIVGAVNKLKSYGFLRTSQASFSIGGGMDNLLEEIVGINEYGKEFVDFCLA